jgi:hypothetical protein
MRPLLESRRGRRDPGCGDTHRCGRASAAGQLARPRPPPASCPRISAWLLSSVQPTARCRSPTHPASRPGMRASAPASVGDGGDAARSCASSSSRTGRPGHDVRDHGRSGWLRCCGSPAHLRLGYAVHGNRRARSLLPPGAARARGCSPDTTAVRPRQPTRPDSGAWRDSSDRGRRRRRGRAFAYARRADFCGPCEWTAPHAAAVPKTDQRARCMLHAARLHSRVPVAE